MLNFSVYLGQQAEFEASEYIEHHDQCDSSDDCPKVHVEESSLQASLIVGSKIKRNLKARQCEEPRIKIVHVDIGTVP